jgi:hypothetical protein
MNTIQMLSRELSVAVVTLGLALDSDLNTTRPHENENIIHRFARNFIANSNITILRG